LMVGPLTLSEAQRLKPTDCTVAGQVIYSGHAVGETPQLNSGDAVGGAFVSVVDPDALDVSPCPGCVSAVADTNGVFSITAPVMSGAGLHVSRHSVAGGAIGSYRARAIFTNCASAPTTIAADYVNLGFFVCQIYDNQAVIGALTIMDSLVDVYISTDHIAVGQLPDTEVPAQTGPWVTVPLTAGDMSGPADGTISFTVTRLNPAGGTWQRSGPSGNSNGGWQQVLVGP
jgi:hypothetical protein